MLFRFAYIILMLSTGIQLPLYSQYLKTQTISDSLRLHVVFPVSGDTLSFDRIRYAGSTLTGAKVWVQGKRTKVYSSGAFVGMVDLQPGWNTIAFTGRDRFGALEENLKIFRSDDSSPLPSMPTRINMQRLSPQTDVFMSAGEKLKVSFWGSPGGRASCRIDGLDKVVRLQEVPAGKNNDKPGFYRGEILIPDVQSKKVTNIEITLTGKDRDVVRTLLPAKVTVVPSQTYRIAMTHDSLTSVYKKPQGDFWFTMPKDVKVRIVSHQNGFTKIKFSDETFGYVRTQKLVMLLPGTSFQLAKIANPAVWQDKNWLYFNMAVSEKMPFIVQSGHASSVLNFKLFHVEDSPKWILHPVNDAIVRRIVRQQQGDDCILRLELNRNQSWGYRAWYSGDRLYLNIRQAPVFVTGTDSLLKGLVFAVDAGHGGDNEGAISATGLLEKNLNLFLAQDVAKSLRALGAKVIMTRTGDEKLTLPERVKIARDAGTHIFLSIHYNSVSAHTDPLRGRGTATYFSFSQSQNLARSVYSQLLKLRLRPFGCKVAPFFVTRQTDFLSCLVEGTFITHPLDEMFLLRENALRSMADAITEGVKKFVLKQRKLVDVPATEHFPTSPAPASSINLSK